MSDTHTFTNLKTGETITVYGVTHAQIIARLCAERRLQVDATLRGENKIVNTIRAEISDTGLWEHRNSGRRYAIKMRICALTATSPREQHIDPLPAFARGPNGLRGWV